MSVAAVSWCKTISVGSGTRKAVLMAICYRADDDGQCRLSRAAIAEEVELGIRTVDACISDLEARALICCKARSRAEDVFTVRMGSG